jgi:CDP-diacylglycerol--serine O-phosphatidyltransferase
MRPGSPAAAFHVSNGLTYASLGCSVAALSAAAQRDTPLCGIFLAVAVLLDTLDGRFARAFRGAASAELGAQLDSLVDAIAFGIVPFVCAASMFTSGANFVWWSAAFTYAACAVTRLGFYNVARQEDGFVGLPVPVAALFWSSAFLFEPRPAILISVALASSLAMIAPVRIPRPSGAWLALFIAWPVALIVVQAMRLV